MPSFSIPMQVHGIATHTFHIVSVNTAAMCFDLLFAGCWRLVVVWLSHTRTLNSWSGCLPFFPKRNCSWNLVIPHHQSQCRLFPLLSFHLQTMNNSCTTATWTPPTTTTKCSFLQVWLTAEHKVSIQSRRAGSLQQLVIFKNMRLIHKTQGNKKQAW